MARPCQNGKKKEKEKMNTQREQQWFDQEIGWVIRTRAQLIVKLTHRHLLTLWCPEANHIAGPLVNPQEKAGVASLWYSMFG